MEGDLIMRLSVKKAAPTWKKSFTEAIKDFVSYYRWEDYLLNSEEKIYLCDLPQFILEEEYRFEKVFSHSYENEIFIRDNWNAATEAVEYLEELGMKLDDYNPFKEPGQNKFVLVMVEMGVNDYLRNSQFIEGHWNDEMYINAKVIKTIMDELGMKVSEETQRLASMYDEIDEIIDTYKHSEVYERMAAMGFPEVEEIDSLSSNDFLIFDKYDIKIVENADIYEKYEIDVIEELAKRRLEKENERN